LLTVHDHVSDVWQYIHDVFYIKDSMGFAKCTRKTLIPI